MVYNYVPQLASKPSPPPTEGASTFSEQTIPLILAYFKLAASSLSLELINIKAS